jgi:hypothetical protein
MAPNTNFNLEWIFSYHPPSPETIPHYERIRSAAKVFAQVILDETIQCADQTAAIRLLRECVMTSNATVALEGSLTGPLPLSPK